MRYNSILLEGLTPEEKMQAWIDGTRGFNYKSADVEKIVNNISVLINIYNKTHNIVAIQKAELLLNFLDTLPPAVLQIPAARIAGLKQTIQNIKQANNTRATVNSTQTNNSAQAPFNWDIAADMLYKNVLAQLAVSVDYKKLNNQPMQSFMNIPNLGLNINAPDCTFMVDKNNKQTIVDGIYYFDTSANGYRPVSVSLVKTRTEQFLTEGAVQNFLTKLAVANAAATIVNFFANITNNLVTNILSSLKPRRTGSGLQICLDLTAAKDLINPKYTLGDANEVYIDIIPPAPVTVGLSTLSHTINKWKDLEYLIDISFANGTRIHIKEKLNDAIKRAISDIKMQFKLN